MTILLTGATGLVGQALLAADPFGRKLVPTLRVPPDRFPDATPLDLTDPNSIRAAVAATEPDWVINAAGMTDVDACQRDPEAAHAVNAQAVGRLAETCQDHGARLLHLSTDQVFDGRLGPYGEDDPTGPINVYGSSKLAGEEAARAVLGDQALVARCSVLFGPHRPTFVDWCRDELTAGRSVRAATDQQVTPTHTSDLVAQLAALIDADARGIWHTAGGTTLTRYDIARAVAAHAGADAALVQPCKAEELGWEAPRPLTIGLRTERIRKLTTPLSFEEAVTTHATDTEEPA